MIRTSAFWLVSHVQADKDSLSLKGVFSGKQNNASCEFFLRPGSYMKSVPSGTVGTPSGSGATARSDSPGN